MNKKIIITALFALVAMVGQGQIKPDTITINFLDFVLSLKML